MKLWIAPPPPPELVWVGGDCVLLVGIHISIGVTIATPIPLRERVGGVSHEIVDTIPLPDTLNPVRPVEEIVKVEPEEMDTSKELESTEIDSMEAVAPDICNVYEPITIGVPMFNETSLKLACMYDAENNTKRKTTNKTLLLINPYFYRNFY
jgi:hypothetical protein